MSYNYRGVIVSDLISRVAQSIRTFLVKALLKSVDDTTKIQLVRVGALENEIFDSVERMQDYGFSSNPPINSEVLLGEIGGSRDHPIVVKVDSAAYRPKNLIAGEVIVYSQHGQRLLLTSTGQIYVNNGSKKVARDGDRAVSNIVIDSEFFTFINAVASFCSLTPPTSLTVQINEGSEVLKSD